jgi:hypothetical protein
MFIYVYLTTLSVPSNGKIIKVGKHIIQAKSVGRDTAVGIATRYGLDGTGIVSRWGRNFLQPSRPDLVPTLSSVQRVLSLFSGGKTAEAWRLPPIPSNPEVEERVKPYLYSPSGPSRPVLGWNLPFSFTCMWKELAAKNMKILCWFASYFVTREGFLWIFIYMLLY